MPPQAARRQARQVEHAGQAPHRVLQRLDADEDQSEPGQREAQRPPAPVPQQFQKRAQPHQRQRVKSHADLQTQHRHDPARAGRAQTRAEHHAHRLRKGQQAGTDETDHRHGRGAGGLHHGRDERARRKGLGRRAGEPHQPESQRIAGKRLEAVGQQHHAQQEQADAADKFEQESGHGLGCLVSLYGSPAPQSRR